MMKLKLLSFILLAFCLSSPAFSATRIPGSVRDRVGKEVVNYKSSFALVIGNIDYSGGWRTLPGVKTDIDAVKNSLQQKGFKVILRQNLSKSALENAFEEFIFEYGMEPSRRLLFYYAGHGESVKNLESQASMSYLVGIDAPKRGLNPSGFLRKSLSMDRVDVFAAQIQSRHALFVFDSCFSGGIFKSSMGGQEHIEEKTGQPVRYFITSGSATEEVPDDSQFRKLFLEGIDGEADLTRDGYVTGTELGMFLHEKIVNYSRKTLHPQYGKIMRPGLDRGDFVFILPQTTGPAPPPGGSLRKFLGNAQAVSRLLVQAQGQSGQTKMTTLLEASAIYDSMQKNPQKNPRILTQVSRDINAAFEDINRPSPPAPPNSSSSDAPFPSSSGLTGGSIPNKNLTVTIETEPKWVYIYDGAGNYLGNSGDPGMFTFKARRSSSLRLVFKKKGYLRQERSLSPQRNTVLQIRLDPKKVLPKSYTNSIGMKFKLIPAGSFTMGAPEWEQKKAYNQCVEQKVEEKKCKSWYLGDSDQHRVEITRPFYMGQYEVTQGQWKEVMGRDSWKDSKEFKSRDQKFKDLVDKDYPVIYVSYEDVKDFIKNLNQREGCSRPNSATTVQALGLNGLPPGCYRLPTEAEWEYATRGGSTTMNYWGNDQDRACEHANVASLAPKRLRKYRWNYPHDCDDNYPELAPVGSYKPNKFGLYDTIGNVWEWTLDWYKRDITNLPTKDPAYLKRGSGRVDRGGGWNGNARGCRSASRDYDSPGKRRGHLGFRLLRTP